MSPCGAVLVAGDPQADCRSVAGAARVVVAAVGANAGNSDRFRAHASAARVADRDVDRATVRNAGPGWAACRVAARRSCALARTAYHAAVRAESGVGTEADSGISAATEGGFRTAAQADADSAGNAAAAEGDSAGNAAQAIFAGAGLMVAGWAADNSDAAGRGAVLDADSGRETAAPSAPA